MHSGPVSRPLRLCGLLSLLLVLATPAVRADGNRSEIAKKQQQLEQIHSRIQTITHNLKQQQRSQSELELKLRDIELNLNDKARAVHQLKQEVSSSQAELKSLRADRSQLQTQLGRHRQVLSSQLRAAYYSGNQEQLKLLLNQQDPSALSRMLRYYQYLNQARLQSIQAAETTLRKLRQTESAIASTNRRLDSLLDARETEYAELKTIRGQQRSVLDKLSAEIATDQRSIDTLRRDEVHVQELIASLKGLFADIPPNIASTLSFAKQRGQLGWPSQGALLNRFGERRSSSDLVWHGIRIQAAQGSDVQAVSHGRVAFADWLPGFGLILILDHNDGFMSLYGHNEALYKETGDWVSAHEVIASVGRSGTESASSLYFEIRHNGKPVDPAQWCSPRRG